MGSGASTIPQTGVPLNPRVEYTDKRVKDVGKSMVIDAPVLIDLGHGTIRYRYIEDKDESNRIEKPHEGPERKKKHGYFYHAKLNDFSEDAHHTKEDDFKFRYVFKGPQKAKQKRMFFVVGKSKNGKQNDIKSPSHNKPKGIGYQWPAVYKKPHHVYYQLEFMAQDGELSDEEEDMELDDPDTKQHKIQYKVKATDTIDNVLNILSVCVLKPTEQIHIVYQDQETENDTEISELRSSELSEWKNYLIQLTQI